MNRAVLIILCLCLLMKEHLFKITSVELSEDVNEENGSLSCECGKMVKSTRIIINTFQAKYLISKETFYPSVFGQRFKNCSVCEISSTQCYGDPKDFSQYRCSKNSVTFRKFNASNSILRNRTESADILRVFKRIHIEYPENVKVPMGIKSVRIRLPRQMEACAYPTFLETSELDCKLYPKSVKCWQYCARGFTLRYGTAVVRTCNKRTNRWRPSNFEECQPFVDCGLTLTSGGAFTCTTPLVRKETECLIKCDRFEDKRAVRENVYTCNIKGQWTPRLPHCVVPGSGLQLVRRTQG